MNISKLNCKEIFREAYERRYTWPKNFNGYKGKCIFIENEKSIEGEFTIGKDFKPQIKNIFDDHIVKSISSQLFEVSIHRVKRDFSQIHQKNNFKFLQKSDNGIKMEVLGKNDGDKYIVKDKKINMVYRQIHGVIIEIFVKEFFDTGNGFLSKRYTSQQLDMEDQSPKSELYEYNDNFINLGNKNLWVLESRIIKYVENMDNKEIINTYHFKDLSEL